jgi:hypothetical protein
MVKRLAHDSNHYAALDIRFIQHCEGNIPALRGRVLITAPAASASAWNW